MIKYGGSLSNEYLLVHRGPGLGVSDGLVHDPRVLRHLGGGEDERGVGRRVTRLELGNGLNNELKMFGISVPFNFRAGSHFE